MEELVRREKSEVGTLVRTSATGDGGGQRPPDGERLNRQSGEEIWARDQ